MTWSPFEYLGLDHISVQVSDMAVSVDFYNRILGMPILHTIEYEQTTESGALAKVGQHFFMGVGGDNPNAHIALVYHKGLDASRDVITDEGSAAVNPAVQRRFGGVNHVDLRVAANMIEPFCDRLAAHGVPFTHVTRYRDPGNSRGAGWRKWKETANAYHEPEADALMSSVYLRDPDGLQLEINVWLPEWDKWPNDAQPWAAAQPG